jgi:hypothetical protein
MTASCGAFTAAHVSDLPVDGCHGRAPGAQLEQLGHSVTLYTPTVEEPATSRASSLAKEHVVEHDERCEDLLTLAGYIDQALSGLD